MFTGEYHHSVDEKGRLVLPSKYRNELGEKFVITRGIEHCLYVYSIDSWNDITNKLNSLPFTKKDAREFTRFFLSGATVAEFDSQGRVNITSPQLSYADIEKECVVVGVGNRLEIWAIENWNTFMDSAFKNMSDIAENLFNERVIE
ncbi:MAG: division/cell wall cluster transcriptional repressor MraZ [Bacilli bacterium]|nr:division/cell wall cluster transcriptional repressor MraZ [Bacilli bacterium]